MMDWGIVKGIITLCMLTFLLIYILKFKKAYKKKSIKTLVIIGVNCYGCKSFIDEKPFDIFKKSSISEKEYNDFYKKENFRLCTSCSRDDKLQTLTKEKIFNLNNFKKYLYSKKFVNLPIAYLIVFCFFMSLDIFFDIAIGFYIAHIIQFTYCYILIKKIDYDYVDDDIQ